MLASGPLPPFLRITSPPYLLLSSQKVLPQSLHIISRQLERDLDSLSRDRRGEDLIIPSGRPGLSRVATAAPAAAPGCRPAGVPCVPHYTVPSKLTKKEKKTDSKVEQAYGDTNCQWGDTVMC